VIRSNSSKRAAGTSIDESLEVPVVDACVVVALATGDARHRDLAQHCFGDWVDEGVQPIAPWLLEAEVLNALWREHRAGRIESARLHQLAGYCRALPIAYKKLPRWDVVLETAALLDQAATYDACYAALAAGSGETLYTFDRPFARRAKEAGLAVELLGG